MFQFGLLPAFSLIFSSEKHGQHHHHHLLLLISLFLLVLLPCSPSAFASGLTLELPLNAASAPFGGYPNTVYSPTTNITQPVLSDLGYSYLGFNVSALASSDICLSSGPTLYLCDVNAFTTMVGATFQFWYVNASTWNQSTLDWSNMGSVSGYVAEMIEFVASPSPWLSCYRNVTLNMNYVKQYGIKYQELSMRIINNITNFEYSYYFTGISVTTGNATLVFNYEICSPYATCVSTACVCGNKYLGNGTFCYPNPCLPSPCLNNGNCSVSGFFFFFFSFF